MTRFRRKGSRSSSGRRAAFAFEDGQTEFQLYRKASEPRRGCLTVKTLEESLVSPPAADLPKDRKIASSRKTRGSLIIRGVDKEHVEGALQVHFKDLTIREYDIIPDTNPGIKGKGPSVGLDWGFKELPTVDVDTYEKTRPPRLKLKDIKMTLKERMALLQESGATEEEIREATERIQKAKEERKETMRNMYKEKCELKRESFFKGMKKALRLRKTTETMQDELWDNAQTDSRLVQRERGLK